MSGEADMKVPAQPNSGDASLTGSQIEADIEEGKKLIESDPARAMELFSRALAVRSEKYGDLAEENVQLLVWYGRSLFEYARSMTDAFNTNKLEKKEEQEKPEDKTTDAQPSDQAVTNKPAADIQVDHAKKPVQCEAGVPPVSAETGQAATACDHATSNEGAQSKEPGSRNTNKDTSTDHKDKGAEGDDDDDDDKEDGEEDVGAENDDEQEGGEEVEDEAQLAWEMFETARVICHKYGAVKHLKVLADVYLGLGDISAEKEEFDKALEDYKKAEECYHKMKDCCKRRLAEVQFNIMNVLIMDSQLPEALDYCKLAVATLKSRKKEVCDLMDTPIEGETEEEADAALEKYERELEDVDESLKELDVKLQEIKSAIDQQLDFKKVLKNNILALANLTDATDPADGSSYAAQAVQQQQAQAQANQPVATASAGNQAVSGALNGSTVTKAASATVQNLGTVGRGKSRITLQPTQPSTATAPASKATGTLQGSSAGNTNATTPALPAKRSLADIMGGPGGITTVGFGSKAAPGAAPSKDSIKAAGSAAPASVTPADVEATENMHPDSLAKRAKLGAPVAGSNTAQTSS